MKLHAVIRAYTTAVHGLIRDCETANALDTLDCIEERFAAVTAMFNGIMTECTDAEIVQMRVTKNSMFDLFRKAHDEAFARAIKAHEHLNLGATNDVA